MRRYNRPVFTRVRNAVLVSPVPNGVHHVHADVTTDRLASPQRVSKEVNRAGNGEPVTKECRC